MRIINEKPVTEPEAKKIMQEREKIREMGYEQNLCLEHLKKVVRISLTDAKKIEEELSKIKILKPHQIAAIVSILPDTEEEVKALFSKEATNLKKEEIEQIIAICKKFK